MLRRSCSKTPYFKLHNTQFHFLSAKANHLIPQKYDTIVWCHCRVHGAGSIFKFKKASKKWGRKGVDYPSEFQISKFPNIKHSIEKTRSFIARTSLDVMSACLNQATKLKTVLAAIFYVRNLNQRIVRVVVRVQDMMDQIKKKTHEIIEIERRRVSFLVFIELINVLINQKFNWNLSTWNSSLLLLPSALPPLSPDHRESPSSLL